MLNISPKDAIHTCYSTLLRFYCTFTYTIILTIKQSEQSAEQAYGISKQGILRKKMFQ